MGGKGVIRLTLLLVFGIFLAHLSLPERTPAAQDVPRMSLEGEGATSPWPMFMHDPSHTGRGEAADLVPIEKWSYLTGDAITSSPAIGADGTLYVGSKDNHLHAVNPDGGFKWTYKTLGDVTSSPAIGADGTLYVGSKDKCLHAIDPDNGTGIWTFPTAGYVESPPVIDPDGIIYVGSSDDALYALDPKTGTPKWSFKTEGDILSSPAIGDDGTLYVGSKDACLYAIDPDDGRKLWSCPTGGSITGSPAIGQDGMIYVGSSDNYLYAINPRDGLVDWRYETGGDIVSSPAIGADGTIYVGSLDDCLHAVSPLRGEPIWPPYKTNGDILSSPAIGTDGTIYVGSKGKTLYAIEATGVLKWSVSLGGEILSSVAIGADGTLYVGASDKKLHALGIPSDKGLLRGKVTDIGTDQVIPNANITPSTGQSTTTNVSGRYWLLLDPGVYELITCTKTGYDEMTFPDALITAGQVTDHDFQLNASGPLNIITTDLPPGSVGLSYNAKIETIGGVQPYLFTVQDGKLPPGIVLNPTGPNGGKLQGTPLFQEAFIFVIGLADALGAYAEREFMIEVTQPLTIVTPSPLDRGTRACAYFAVIEATGGTFPFTFTLASGTLPAGLSLSTNGTLSGTPSATGSADFTLRVDDASGRQAEAAFRIDVDDPVVIDPNQVLEDGIKGEVYAQTLLATGGYGDYTWNVYSGTLPDGLTLSHQGVLSGTPSETCYKTIVVSVHDEEGRVAYRDLLLQVVAPLTILTLSLPDGLKDSPYSEAVKTLGGKNPLTFTGIGQWPSGLTMGRDGIISGTPTVAGVTNARVTVTDSTSPTPQIATKDLSIRITSDLTIMTGAVLPNARKGQAINPIVLVAGGGPSPHAWSIPAGSSLPNGMSLTPSGVLSGIPLQAGDFTFKIKVEDADTDMPAEAEKEFFLHISDTIFIATAAIPDGGAGKAYSVALEARGGLPPYAWRLTNGQLPAGLTLNPATGAISGTPTTRQIATFTIEVSDADATAQTAEKTYVMEVSDTLLITTEELKDGVVEEAYSETLTAQLGKPPYTWLCTAGVLPPGLRLISSPSTATIQGSPSRAGSYPLTIEVADSGTPVARASKEFTLHILERLAITTETLPDCYQNVAYETRVSAQGGTAPYTWILKEGTLPLGLTLNGSTGFISGIPTEGPGYSTEFTVQVTDSGTPQKKAEKVLVLSVLSPLAITTAAIQGAMQKAFYSVDLHAQGGIAPYRWSLESGPLPDGIGIDEDTGVLSGIPLPCGDYPFTVKIADGSAVPNVASKAFTLVVTCCNDYTLSGTVTGEVLEGILITLEGGGPSRTTSTDGQGIYRFEHLTNSTYSVTPTMEGLGFEPRTRDVSISHQDIEGVDFTSFANAAPHIPFSPSPEDGALDVPIASTLSWEGGDPNDGDIVTYDLYFGTSLPLTRVASDLSEQTFEPGLLTPGTDYSWQVIARDLWDVESEGPIWRFSTAPAPVVDFAADPLDGDVPLSVQFTDLSTGTVTTWAWDFGEGGTSTEQNPLHTYRNAGTYQVTLKVTGPGGAAEETKAGYITVNGSDWEGAYASLLENPGDLGRLRSLRDRLLLEDREARGYIRTLYTHSGAALTVLQGDPVLMASARHILAMSRAAAQSVLNGHEGTIGHTEAILLFLGRFAEAAPPELRALVARARNDIQRGRELGTPFLGFRFR